MPALGTAYVVIKASLAPLKAGLALAKTAVTKAMGAITAIIRKMSRIIKKIFKYIVTAAILGSVYAFGKFEQAMRKATAVSDTTERQFSKMSEMARQTAIRLNISAHDAAEAFYFLGSAGLSVSDQIKAFTPVATLAKAAVIDMGSAAEMVVDTMKGFRIGFENTTHVTDVLAKAVTSSNTTFAQLGEALSYVSGVAKMTNNTLEETTTVLATMADVGYKGSKAGIALRRAMLNLAAPMSNMRKMMADYNIEVYDANSRMKPFVQLVGEISEKLKGATEQQRNMAFKTLFGARAIAGQIAVFYKGKDALDTFTKSLQEAGGTAAEIAAKQLNALAQQFGILRKMWRNAAITIGNMLAPALRVLIDYSKEMADKVGGFLKKHEDAIRGWAMRVAQIFIDLSQYLKTDWREAINYALETVRISFSAFVDSLKVILLIGLAKMHNMFIEWGVKISEQMPFIGDLVGRGVRAQKIKVGSTAKIIVNIYKRAFKEIADKLPPVLKNIFTKLAPLPTAAAVTAAAAAAGRGGIQLGGGLGVGAGAAAPKLGFVSPRELWRQMAMGLTMKKDKTAEEILKYQKVTAEESAETNRILEHSEGGLSY